MCVPLCTRVCVCRCVPMCVWAPPKRPPACLRKDVSPLQNNYGRGRTDISTNENWMVTLAKTGTWEVGLLVWDGAGLCPTEEVELIWTGLTGAKKQLAISPTTFK